MKEKSKKDLLEIQNRLQYYLCTDEVIFYEYFDGVELVGDNAYFEDTFKFISEIDYLIMNLKIILDTYFLDELDQNKRQILINTILKKFKGKNPLKKSDIDLFEIQKEYIQKIVFLLNEYLSVDKNQKNISKVENNLTSFGFLLVKRRMLFDKGAKDRNKGETEVMKRLDDCYLFLIEMNLLAKKTKKQAFYNLFNPLQPFNQKEEDLVNWQGYTNQLVYFINQLSYKGVIEKPTNVWKITKHCFFNPNPIKKEEKFYNTEKLHNAKSRNGQTKPKSFEKIDIAVNLLIN